MKRFLLSMFALLAFVACAESGVEEQLSVGCDAPDEIIVGFEGDDTRIQLNEAQKTVWTKGDFVSVFYRSNANEKWQFQGETGDRIGSIKRVVKSEATKELSKVVVVYPYNEGYYINPESCNVEVSMPAVQHYMEGSYGLDGNIMISSNEFNQVSLKSIYGWLKLQLTGGGDVVKSIRVRGNDGEQMAGLLYINSSSAVITLASEMGSSDDGEAGGVGGGLVFDDTILETVTLDCGDGVVLTDEVVSFYIALPPQVFTKGVTVEIEDANGHVMEKTTDNEIVIERNHIQPMSSFTFVGPAIPEVPANNQICYTATQKVEPYSVSDLDVNLLSNIFNKETGRGVMIFDGDVVKVGAKTFEQCKNLTGVTLPDSVTSLGERVFYNCSGLVCVNIPKGVTSIGNYAFYNCDALIDVVIPEGVTAIGHGMFQDSNSLASVTIPEGVVSIGERAFQACNLTSVVLPDSLTTIGSYAFQNCKSMLRVEFGDGVEIIGQYAFYNCAGVTSVTLPDCVTEISNQAFRGCKALTSLYCKALVPPSMGTYIFYDTSSDFAIYVPAESVEDYKSETSWSSYVNKVVGYDFEKDIIAGTQPHNEIWYTSSDGNVVVPNRTDVFGVNIVSNTYADGKGVITFDGNVTSIGEQAFYYCRSLTTISIPNRVESIGYQAFDNCSYLTNFTIGDSVKTIGICAFFNCECLTDVVIPDSVEDIYSYAFKYCKNLKSVTIGDSVTSIGTDAFRICLQLSSVYCKAVVPPTLSGAFVFYDNESDRKIYVPTESVNAYKSADGWQEWASEIVSYEF